MTTQNRIEGPNLILRLITPEDAEYVHGLRVDPRYNQHLSAVTGTADDQRAWIERYKTREAAGEEYYFVIERRADGQRCGVVRLYDIDRAAGQFTWGSWILDENKPPKAALESALCLYDFAYEKLDLPKAVFDVRKDNARTLAFHRRFGAVETGVTDDDILFELPRESFLSNRGSLYAVLTEVTTRNDR